MRVMEVSLKKLGALNEPFGDCKVERGSGLPKGRRV
jgi:hypothetical protein